jgi:hypothetical protein
MTWHFLCGQRANYFVANLAIKVLIRQSGRARVLLMRKQPLSWSGLGAECTTRETPLNSTYLPSPPTMTIPRPCLFIWMGSPLPCFSAWWSRRRQYIRDPAHLFSLFSSLVPNYLSNFSFHLFTTYISQLEPDCLPTTPAKVRTYFPSQFLLAGSFFFNTMASASVSHVPP